VSLSAAYHALARADLYVAWAWYEDQQSELGDRFAAAVDAAVQRIARWPKSGSPAVRDEDDEIIERRLATPGFPYAIRYRVVEGTLLVMAVAHQHRRPDFVADRQP
jgi:plasmid stabilization system protein ParE